MAAKKCKTEAVAGEKEKELDLGQLPKDMVTLIHHATATARLAHCINQMSEGTLLGACNLFEHIKAVGGVVAGSASLHAYMGEDMATVDDIDIWVDHRNTTPYSPRDRSDADAIFHDTFVSPVGESYMPLHTLSHRIANFSPFVPPSEELHPLEQWLWDTWKTPEVVRQHVERVRDKSATTFVDHPVDGSNRLGLLSDPNSNPLLTSTSITVLVADPDERYITCKHRPGLMRVRTFKLGRLKIQVLSVDPTACNHEPVCGSVGDWVRRHFDVSACSAALFDGEAWKVRHHTMLMRKLTYMLPTCGCKLAQEEYQVPKHLATVAIATRSTVPDSKAAHACTSQDRIDKYVGRGWRFVDMRRYTNNIYDWMEKCILTVDDVREEDME